MINIDEDTLLKLYNSGKAILRFFREGECAIWDYDLIEIQAKDRERLKSILDDVSDGICRIEQAAQKLKRE